MDQQFSPECTVANDISWGTLSVLQQNNSSTNIIFTNHNLHRLPFDLHFDLVIFKNTLHHIDDDRKRDVIESLDNISDQLVIVDVEDPTNYNLKSKAWNWYYRSVLGDEGEDFLADDEFKHLIDESISAKQIGFRDIETIKGNYMIASARTPDSSEES